MSNAFGTSVVDERHSLPLEIRPGDLLEGTSHGLISWWQRNSSWVDEKLHFHGALRFRGFGIDSQPILAEVTSSVNQALLDYVDGNSPRTKVGSGVYTSTEYPPEFFISMHNELSYAKEWPARLHFCCVTPAPEGGETPLCDHRALLRNLEEPVVEEFRSKGVTYIRNLHGGQGFGPSWQDTFETQDRADIERYAADSEAKIEWKEDRSVRLAATRPATHVHPVTGEEVWFNQADQFHPTTHPKAVYESMNLLYKGRGSDMPQYVTFGDGSEIPVETLEHIRETTKDLLVISPWEQGDLVVVDNVLVSHGRMPFKGERRVLVSMA
nr:dapdiamide synthesis protein DdaC-like [Nerophis lumbriciformis]